MRDFFEQEDYWKVYSASVTVGERKISIGQTEELTCHAVVIKASALPQEVLELGDSRVDPP